MNETTRELIAVGASLTANCKPCLKYHVGKARENGATEREISEAVEIAHLVRQGAAKNIDGLTEKLAVLGVGGKKAKKEGCGCGAA
jgi:AhpD family alkylhydroperoxidase